jgi:hypothetical protein
MGFSPNILKLDRFQTIPTHGKIENNWVLLPTYYPLKPVRFLNELSERTTTAVFERKPVVGGRGLARAEMLGVQRPGCVVHRNAHGNGEQLISLGERVKTFSQRRGQSIL